MNGGWAVPWLRDLVVAQHGEAVAKKMEREARADAKLFALTDALPPEQRVAAYQAVPPETWANAPVARRLVREAVRNLTRKLRPVPPSAVPRAIRTAPRRREHRAGATSRGAPASGDDSGPSSEEPPPPPAAQLLRVREVCARLGVSRSLVNWWLTEGLLPAVRLPSSGAKPLLRIPQEAVDRFAASFRLHERRPRPRAVSRGIA